MFTTSQVVTAADLSASTQETLAERHLKHKSCAELCHVNEIASDDLVYEQQSCVNCHGSMADLKGSQHNRKHQVLQMECLECHMSHEEFDPKEICLDCHSADEPELSEFYSTRVDRFFHSHAYFMSRVTVER
ncbi:cytochrome c3 family protein [Vibrio ponticus]|nr:cytochrome c3 family protein [Vibrio ponticus]